jgi:hypothetical protein
VGSHRPAATVAWLEAQPAGPTRDRLFEQALHDVCWDSTDDASLFTGGIGLRLVQQLPAESAARAARDLGVRRGKADDLTDLATWAQHFPAGPARAEAIGSTLNAAHGRDASRVDALLSQLTAPADRDAALRGLTTAMAVDAPAPAAKRALAIADAALRRETFETILTEWRQSNAGAARAWQEAH